MIIFGHRGAAGLAPENTLKSFEKALTLGVDGVEFDVRLCADNELIVFHDKRLERTTNGHGKVRSKTFSELRKLDAGQGEQISTLSEVCELISNKVLINIELKGKNTAEPVMEYLLSEENDIPLEQFLISSFRYKELKKARKLSPDISIGVLAERNYKKALKRAEKIHAYSFHASVKSVKQKHIAKAKELGLKSYIYTVNDLVDYKRLDSWKADGVFTDFPDRFLKLD